MGCGCQQGSGAGATGSLRVNPTKRPGYTWNGPEVEKQVEPTDETAEKSGDEK